MIPSNSPSSVNWTAPTAPVATAVPAVMAVAPAAPASRDAQPGLEQQRRGQARAVQARDAQAAQAERDRAADNAQVSATEREARAERQALERDRAAQREQEQHAAMEHLRQALRKVWDASGAVVEQALAREQDPQGSAGAPRVRSVDAYEAPTDAAPRSTGLSKRV
ncbi:MAG: hypothetical protein KF871_07090 [Hydrogenophaga sp.]|uniref:hypothetical protein n=1 Tax=Hydrogenophaga sp. TaxID=1904254 RepID=UPI001D43A76C|nr:hypothetical protein [Hydrogenophaga sp.]MBX3609648.1 hypothetical protein [Hydrogenophaga sp.]